MLRLGWIPKFPVLARIPKATVWSWSLRRVSQSRARVPFWVAPSGDTAEKPVFVVCFVGFMLEIKY